ncbi:FG-GAP repeat domain-containing protein [Streptomyces sp. NBC_01198]|uniref:FG-GAP repeat domain-containing protein n=1 Tax=Streptomyces sp. NBC_01198 TaxID=2903769 RepID=UPI002E137114|nr:VCBS repeat-containing protein [Streptomyces sp. NBC_01198]
MRLTAVCALTAALAAGTLAAAGGAAADSDFVPLVRDISLGPGNSSEVNSGAYGTADGTAVYALSKTPLTDAGWAGGGLPAGLTASLSDTGCTAYAGAPGVYTCPVSEDYPLASPTVVAADDAANHTTAYVGAAYAPRGTSLATAVKAAELAGTTSTPDVQTAGVITVLTPEQVAKSTVELTTPDVPLSASTVQTVHVHAADPAYLAVNFSPTSDERWNDEEEVDVKVTAVGGGPADACDHTTDSLTGGHDAARCQLPAGDYTITYTLTAGPEVEAWKLVADAVLNVVDYGSQNPEATSTFKVLSPTPVSERYRLFGRTADGTLMFYDGTGNASTPFRSRDYFEDGWQQYTAATALSAVTLHGTGDVVARDGSGNLWYYRGSGTNGYDFLQPRTKVGGGWNTYDTITGAGDLTGDGKADLLGRDASGVLWLYKGTDSTTAPFAARTGIGAGWNTYTTLTATGDLTGDGKADLVGVDASGGLWLYKGTGDATAPYAARTKVGTGWSTYTVLLGPGDLTGDGKADLVGRDASGGLWLYKGTGNAAAPYAARTKVGGGWNTYNLMF